MANDYLIGPGLGLAFMLIAFLAVLGVRLDFDGASEVNYIYIAMGLSFIIIYFLGYIVEMFARGVYQKYNK